MKKKIVVNLAAIIALLSFAGGIFAATVKTKKTTRQNSQMVAALPSSDFVARIDLQRLMQVALPQVLGAQPQTLTGINAKIDQIKAQTGIDLRQFEQLAVGVKYEQSAPPKIDLLPVALARGSENADALLTAVKLVAKNNLREEKFGSKTIYIFTPREIAQKNNPQNGNRSVLLPGLGMIVDLDKIFAGEIAVAVLDNNTLVFGKPSRVRQTLEGNSRVEQKILALVNRNSNALVSFGGSIPNEFFTQLFGLTENDEIGRNINSIRQIYGALDAGDNSATVSMTAKTTNAKEAEDLESTASGLQTLGKSVLGGMRGGDKQVYARMAENAKITREGSEVMLNLQIPQSDIDVLLGKK